MRLPTPPLAVAAWKPAVVKTLPHPWMFQGLNVLTVKYKCFVHIQMVSCVYKTDHPYAVLLQQVPLT